MAVKVREKIKGSGVFWIFINHNGKRKSKKIGDKKLALEVAKKIEAKLTLGEFDMKPKAETKAPTFKSYSEFWLETYIKPIRRQSTYERYSHLLKNQVFARIGKYQITELTRSTIRECLLAIYGQGYSKSTICLVRDVISGPLQFALDDELIKANPASGILKRMSFNRDRGANVNPFTPDEVAAFFETCEKTCLEYYPFFLCAFRTGMRMGELLGLQWGDVDWHGKFIEVKRSYKLKRISETKNGKIRRVDMTDQLYDSLRMVYTVEEAAGSSKFIFHRKGNPIEQNFIRRVFKRILKAAGLREIRFHDIRHTFASSLLTDGVTPVYVKEQLGHSSIKMTVDVYGHLIPSSNRDMINKLDAMHPSRTLYAPTKKNEAQLVEIAPHINLWCRRGDSNSHGNTSTRP
jgi:integrase